MPITRIEELTDEELQQTLETYRLLDGNISATARELGVGRHSVKYRLRKAKARGIEGSNFLETKFSKAADVRDSYEVELNDDSGRVVAITRKAYTEEEILKRAQVDLERWEPSGSKVKFWTTPMKIKTRIDTDKDGKAIYEDDPIVIENNYMEITLKRRAPRIAEEAVERLIGRLPRLRVPKLFIAAPSEKGVAGEMALYDAHFGKFAWNEETMQGNQDIKITREIYLKATTDNLNHIAPYNPSKIFFVVGQDLLHFENIWGLTPLGKNHLDTDSRLPKVIDYAIDSVLQSIYLQRQVAPVEIVPVPGNHDMHAILWMARVLHEHFKDDPHVTIDISPCCRKAKLWGNLLVAWSHDAEGRKMVPTANMLAQWWPDLWGQSVFREWHVGHLHKKEENKFRPVLSVGGVLIRRIAALTTVDQWHVDGVFIDAIPAGESFIWTKDAGITANFQSIVRYDQFTD